MKISLFLQLFRKFFVDDVKNIYGNGETAAMLAERFDKAAAQALKELINERTKGRN